MDEISRISKEDKELNRSILDTTLRQEEERSFTEGMVSVQQDHALGSRKENGKGDPDVYNKEDRKDRKGVVIDPELFMRKKTKALTEEMLKFDTLAEINESNRLLRFYEKKQE